MANFKGISADPISVLAGWEEWNGSSWVAASAIPTAGDVAYANGFNKEIDQSWTVAEIRNGVFQGTTGSGRFEILSAGITFDGHRYSMASFIGAVLYVSFGNGTSSVLGLGETTVTQTRTLDIVGLSDGVLNLEDSGIGNITNSVGTTVTGNGNGFTINLVTASGGLGSNSYGISLGGSNYNLILNGMVVHNSITNTVGYPITIGGSGNRFVNNGIIYGPSNVQGNTMAGVYNPGVLNEIVNNGVAEATAFGPAIVQMVGNYAASIPNYTTSSTSWITLGDGCTLTGTNQHPAIIGRIRVDDGADVQWLTKSPTTQTEGLYSAGQLGYPPEAKVENGEVYGPSSEFEGTLLPWSPAFAQALANAQRDLQLPQILSAITAP